MPHCATLWVSALVLRQCLMFEQRKPIFKESVGPLRQLYLTNWPETLLLSWLLIVEPEIVDVLAQRFLNQSNSARIYCS